MDSIIRRVVIIAAGGIGERMGSSVPKQALSIEGESILDRVLSRFQSSPHIDGIVVVLEQSLYHHHRDLGITVERFSKLVSVTPGGSSRTESVWQGLACLPRCEIVLIHDAVRPFVTESMIGRAVLAAESHGAAIPIIPLTDTLKRLDGEGKILETLRREEYVLVQTPQAFRREVIVNAYRVARESGRSGTDDASLVEAMGLCVTTFPGDPDNVKITVPRDLLLAEFLLQRQSESETESESETGVVQ